MRRLFSHLLGTRRSFGLSLLALALFSMCIGFGGWQYERGENRRAENQIIERNIELGPIAIPQALNHDRARYQGRLMEIVGTFLPEREILLRNRYFQDQYGFAVTTLFQLVDGRLVWIDRGWVRAGASATEVPEIDQVPSSQLKLLVRYRDDALDAKVRGSFFATGSGRSELARWNEQEAIRTEDFYFDLVGGDFTPRVPTPPPLVSNGPHFAYAIQWWFFAALALFGRGLIAREDMRGARASTS